MSRFWKHAFLFHCAGAVTVFTAARADVTLLLAEPPTKIIAGERARLTLNALNTSNAETTWTFPGTIACRLVASNTTHDVRLDLEPPASAVDVRLTPGQFESRGYWLNVPRTIQGRALLECPALPVNRVVVEIAAPINETVARDEPKSAARRFFQEAEPTLPGGSFDAGRFFAEHVSRYEPLYFIAGTESPNAKFQISFKYRLLNNEGPIARRVPPLRGFHVAYTQISLWDWNAASAPFFDSSYKPEFLYAAENLTRGESTNWFRLDAQLGLQHESNGKDGANSRSLNIAYLRPSLVFGKHDGFQLTLQPRVWTYVGDLSDNSDIADFRGYADLRAIVGWERGPQLSATGRLGKDGDHEAVQLDFTYPLMEFFPRSFSLYLHIQYYTGFGESLLRYNERDSSLRAGFSLTR